MKTGLIETIKARVMVPDFLSREFGIRIVGKNRAKSWREGSTHPDSLIANERDWYDFGLGKGGDIIDLAAYSKFDGDKGQAIRYLAERWGIKEVIDIPESDIIFRSYLAIMDQATTFYQQSLKEHHLNYLRGRGLTDDTIHALRLGWAENPCQALKEAGFDQQQIAESGVLSFVNRLMIPYLRNGRTVYLIGRESSREDEPSSNPGAKYMKLYRADWSEHPIWGYETLVTRKGPVIIAEGIFDAISCWQEGYPVVTAVTGAFSSEQKKDLFPALKGRDVTICMDYDPVTKAGQKFTETLASELFEAGIHVSVCLLHGDGKKIDISDLYAANPERKTLEKIFGLSRDWEEIQIERIAEIGNENEKRGKLAVFLRRCATCFDWPTVAQLAENARKTGKFAEAWLKELVKSLKSPPSDDAVVREFTEKNDCLFHESLGWYEYTGSVWEKILETEVRRRIAGIFGRYRTNNRVNSVYQLLKGELIFKSDFDRDPDLINFRNGMFDISSGKLLPHSRDYYSAIQFDYSYDDQAKCQEWDAFIDDVTAGDVARHNVLQEMFGYCLTRDARYQKCFFLIGDGANGKSVLLSVLKAMVSPKNTSHVEISSLESAFERICLHNKLVNLASETKSDVRGTEAIFKQIVAGDPISGCFKGKDFVTFTPFCKIIFAANEQIQARDISYGFLRRICFVRFPVRFCDDPNEEKGERQKVPNLTEKLLQELPGIFNWAMSGLRALRHADKFSGTGDQSELTTELVSISNPLVAFVDDVIDGRDWSGKTRKQLYKAYNDWCQETNTMEMSARSFWPRLRRLVEFDEKKIHGDYFLYFKTGASKDAE